MTKEGDGFRGGRLGPGRIATVAGLVASAAFLVAIAWPVVANRPLRGDDLGRFHGPIRAFYARCLAEGDEPLWHPGLYCGFYIHGEGQAGMDHPLHRGLYTFLPLKSAFAVEVVIGYPLLFLGMVVCCGGVAFAPRRLSSEGSPSPSRASCSSATSTPTPSK